MVATRRSNPPPVPKVRGKYLRSQTRIRGANKAHEWLTKAVASQHLSQHFLARVLEVDQSWVQKVLSDEECASLSLGDAFELPPTLRISLANALLTSVANDNNHEK